jgi:hypothetical protein
LNNESSISSRRDESERIRIGIEIEIGNPFRNDESISEKCDETNSIPRSGKSLFISQPPNSLQNSQAFTFLLKASYNTKYNSQFKSSIEIETKNENASSFTQSVDPKPSEKIDSNNILDLPFQEKFLSL